jgi:hypothetical protein
VEKLAIQRGRGEERDFTSRRLRHTRNAQLITGMGSRPPDIASYGTGQAASQALCHPLEAG